MKILLGENDHPSAFTPVQKPSNEMKSFIVIRELPRLWEKSAREGEDSDSTHHSNGSPKLIQKVSKEEKRSWNLLSIQSLIESRKSDTFKELEKHPDDENIVLKCSPKPITRNSKLSHFRGVSHNGKKWQVMIMGFAKKIYFGGLATEKEASEMYDKYAILMHGFEVSLTIFHQFSIGQNKLQLYAEADVRNFEFRCQYSVNLETRNPSY